MGSEPPLPPPLASHRGLLMPRAHGQSPIRGPGSSIGSALWRRGILLLAMKQSRRGQQGIGEGGDF